MMKISSDFNVLHMSLGFGYCFIVLLFIIYLHSFSDILILELVPKFITQSFPIETFVVPEIQIQINN